MNEMHTRNATVAIAAPASRLKTHRPSQHREGDLTLVRAGPWTKQPKAHA